MDTDNYLFFLATPGGKSHTEFLAVLEERGAAQKARVAYIEEHKIQNLWGSDRGIAGYVIKEHAEIPAGWMRSKKYNPGPGEIVIVPDGRKKALIREIEKKLAAIPSLPDSFAFSRRIGFGGYIGARAWRAASGEKIGDRVIIFVPKRDAGAGEHDAGQPDEAPEGKRQFIPPDCTPLKASEYFRMKEEHEAAQKKEQPAPAETA